MLRRGKIAVTLFGFVAAVLATVQLAHAQQSTLGNNLIQNGDAESGLASPDGKTVVASIPNWVPGTVMANVLPYDLTGYVLLSDPRPPDHGFHYFAGNPKNVKVTLTQDIPVSSGASIINGGTVKYTASAYLGSRSGVAGVPQMGVSFKNANGQTIISDTVGPAGYDRRGMSLQQKIGLVPAGTVLITVALTINDTYGVADSLSLVLSLLGTDPGTVLGKNLVVNGGAELGPNALATQTTLYVPGWSTANGASVAPYGGTGWIAVSDPGPADRAVNLFCGAVGESDSYQDIDVSPASSLIDAGQVKFQVSAWLGGLNGVISPTLTYTFWDWTNNQLAPTAQLGPVRHAGRGLEEAVALGTLPSGTRRVRIAVTFPNRDYVADNIDFTLTAPNAPPVISPSGIISASSFGGSPSIAPGTLIEIYGANLASSTADWGSAFLDGVAPTSLGGVKVSVGGTAAFIAYVSPGQVNALTPSDTPISSGAVDITLTNSNGSSDPYGIYVNQTQAGLRAPPLFKINGKQYVAATFSDLQTFALPEGAISGVPSRPAMPGETLIIYGIGFGPTTSGVSAGTIPMGQNPLTTPVQFFFGTASATVAYSGLAPGLAGLYQFNVVVPNVSANDAVPISINLGGVKGSQQLYIAVGK